MFKARWLTALLAVAALGLATSAQAAGTLQGMGALEAKDVKRSTVTIDARVYRVNDRTVLQGIEGERVSLEEIPVASSGQDGGFCEYEALETGRGLVLERLEMSETPE